jgi:hypothetical protein
MMFLNWRTNEELIAIVNDDTVDPHFRMNAATERIYRTSKPCTVPGCKNRAEATWATVPICLHCRDKIKIEQHNYYSKRWTAAERTVLNKIKPLIPWMHEQEVAGL